MTHYRRLIIVMKLMEMYNSNKIDEFKGLIDTTLGRIPPYEVSLRRKGGVTASDAYAFKAALDILMQLDASELSDVMADTDTVGKQPYGKYTYGQYATSLWKKYGKPKSNTEDIDEFYNAVWSAVESNVIEQSHEYIKWFEAKLRVMASKYAEYKNLSYDDAKKLYPRGYSNPEQRKNYNAYVLTSKRNFADILEKERAGYITASQDTIKKLAARTIEALGNVSNIRVGTFTNNSLTVTVDTETETINVTLYAIGAGGYNIQRYHTRWLIKFIKNSKSYEIH